MRPLDDVPTDRGASGIDQPARFKHPPISLSAAVGFLVAAPDRRCSISIGLVAWLQVLKFNRTSSEQRQDFDHGGPTRTPLLDAAD